MVSETKYASLCLHQTVSLDLRGGFSRNKCLKYTEKPNLNWTNTYIKNRLLIFFILPITSRCLENTLK